MTGKGILCQTRALRVPPVLTAIFDSYTLLPRDSTSLRGWNRKQSSIPDLCMSFFKDMINGAEGETSSYNSLTYSITTFFALSHVLSPSPQW